MKQEMTVKECMQGAFAALLRGDLKERDRLIQLAQLGFGADKVCAGDKSIMQPEGTKQ